MEALSVAAKSQKLKPKAKAKIAAEEPVTPPRRSLLSRVFGSVWRPMPLVVMSLSLAGVMFGPQIVKLLPDLSNRAEYQVTWSDINISTPGRWVPEDFVVQVQRQSDLSDQVSLLDDGLAQSLAEAFARHPWVQSVESVEKQQDGVRVSLTYREPALMVQTKRGLYPVDAEGVLLPPSDFTASDAKQFPRVERVRSTPQGPAGIAWGDIAVAGAARLAARLTRGNDHEAPWQRYGLASIVVLSQRGPVADVEDVLFGLTTATGSQIVWGHAPGEDTLEPTVDQKFERLDKFLADNGRFDSLNEPVRIDITDWEVIRWDVLSKIPQGNGVLR